MLLISYIPKIQSIDKSIALIAELRQEHPDMDVVYIFNIEHKNQISSCSFLLKIIARDTPHSFVLSNSVLQEEMDRIWSEVGAKLYKVDCDFDKSTHNLAAEHILEKIKALHSDSVKNTTLLLPKTDDQDGFANTLKRLAKKQLKSMVYAYFKSVHDAGYGLTTKKETIQSGSRALEKIKNKLSRIWGWLKSSEGAGALTNQYIDVFLCFNRDQASLLQSYGYSDKKTCVIGYPILFPAWKTLMQESLRNISRSLTTKTKIVVFTRGETPGRPPEQNIITNETLLVMLDDIFRICSQEFENAEVYIKPHPIQDVSVIEKYLRTQTHNIVGYLSYDPPSFLAAMCDYAISTYSSTVIDTMAFGVPTIEYLIENEFFRKKHPEGSPFIALGALRANSESELLEHIQALKSGKPIDNKLEDCLGHKKDLSIFKGLRSK